MKFRNSKFERLNEELVSAEQDAQQINRTDFCDIPFNGCYRPRPQQERFQHLLRVQKIFCLHPQFIPPQRVQVQVLEQGA